MVWIPQADKVREEVASMVATFRSHQANPHLHPYTCGHDSSHSNLVVILECDNGFVMGCPDCNYRQIAQLP
jgi:acid phosphatase family membrane protein YuiD